MYTFSIIDKDWDTVFSEAIPLDENFENSSALNACLGRFYGMFGESLLQTGIRANKATDEFRTLGKKTVEPKEIAGSNILLLVSVIAALFVALIIFV
jgi:hypothetical protein